MAKRANGDGYSKWVIKNGKRYWRIRFTTGYDPLTGKQIRKDIYGRTQAEAKSKLKSFLEKHSSKSDNSCLGDFYYNWLWEVKRQELKYSTFTKWEGIYRNYILNNKKLNNAKLVDIDTLYLQKVTNKLLEKHTVSQVKTLNQCLKNCFAYAIVTNKIKLNPVEGIVYPKNFNVLEEKNNYISESEQKQLLNALDGDSQEAIILLGLFCGVRLGEAMALQESDFNFTKKIIKINKSVKYVWTGEYDSKNKKIYDYKVTIPKTLKSIREVPFPTILISKIKKLIKQNKANKLKYGDLYFDNKLVFCKENGLYIDSKLPNRHLKAALKRAKIETDIHFHSLRHIFITNCISKNINIKTIMDWVGHTDTKTTMVIYAEINKDKNAQEYIKIDSMFN